MDRVRAIAAVLAALALGAVAGLPGAARASDVATACGLDGCRPAAVGPPRPLQGGSHGYVDALGGGASATARGGPTLDQVDASAFGARGDGTADDTDALAAAVRFVNARISAGAAPCILLHPGTYLVTRSLPVFEGPGCVRGSGPSNTAVKMSPSLRGDLFSWSEAWTGANGAFPFGGSTVDLPKRRAGPVLRDLAIVGERSAEAQQNAVALHDRVDFAQIENVDVFYVRGRALWMGSKLHAASAFTRESRVVHVRAFNCGDVDAPVIDIGTGPDQADASNEIELEGIDVYAPYGTGLWIHGQNVRDIDGTRIRIEGLEGNPGRVRADLLEVGDGAQPTSNASIHLRGLELIDPYVGFAAAHLAGVSGGDLYDVGLEGWIGGGAPRGGGLRIDLGRSSAFHFSFLHTDEAEVTLGPLAGPDLLLDGDGAERRWTLRGDVAPERGVRFPAFQASRVVGVGDGGAVRAGDVAAVDRLTAPSEADAASEPPLSPQERGDGAPGRAAVARRVAQGGMQMLRAAGQGRLRLTSDGERAGARNCVNVPSEAGYAVTVTLKALDRSVPTNSFVAVWDRAHSLDRPGSAATTLFDGGTAAVKPDSARVVGGVAASASVAADPVNGCMSLVFSPASGLDTWDAVARVDAVPVR